MDLSKKNILIEWFGWHFVAMPRFLFSVWKNYLWFVADYFSIPLLLATLLSPWRQFKFKTVRKFDVGEFFGNLIFNIFSRLMGLVCRLVLIIAGIVSEIIVAVVGVVGIVVWIFSPVIIVALIFFIVHG